MKSLQVDGYWYLATPYSKYPLGRETSFRHSCAAAAALLRNGVAVFSPIAHGHPISEYGGLNPLDHEIWLGLDKKIFKNAYGMIIVKMPNWDGGKGIKYEIDEFKAVGKPIVYMDWPNFEIAKESTAQIVVLSKVKEEKKDA